MSQICLSSSKPLTWFKKGKKINVNDKMQENYSYTLTENPYKNYHQDFHPFYTPREMLSMGVFEGKYMNDCTKEFPLEWFQQAVKNNKLSPAAANPSKNYFGIKSRQSLQVWKEKGWIIKPDPRGWFQWYCRYALGRRIPEVDDIQIKRWKSFIRHFAQVKKHAKGDLSKRVKQRQALLQWSYDCKI